MSKLACFETKTISTWMAKKAAKCAISSVLKMSPSILLKELAVSPQAFALYYGSNFVDCMLFQ